MTINKGLFSFRATPAAYGKDELVTSALQAFESSLIMLSMKRLPHAVVNVSECFEKLLKAEFGRGSFEDLIDQFCDDIAAPLKNRSTMHEFRQYRNDIIHGGFSPEFDQRSMEMYAPSGVHYVSLALEQYHGKTLLGSDEVFFNDGLILGEIAKLIKFTRKVARKNFNKKPAKISIAYYPLIMKLRNYFSPNFISEWQYKCIEHGETTGLFMAERFQEGGDNEKYFDGDREFALCPICSNQLNAYVGRYQEDGKMVEELLGAQCYSCDFNISRENVNYLGELVDIQLNGLGKTNVAEDK